MKNSPKQSDTNVILALPMYRWGVCCITFVLLLFSCSSVPPVLRVTPLENKSEVSLISSMIFIIHGDGNYLYHDKLGNAHQADKETLAKAIKVAVSNRHSEVFIFYQKPRTHTLLFIPRCDGEFYYYRRGQLLTKELYWRAQGSSYLKPEIGLYNRFRTEGHSQSRLVKLLLYFGHEIPEFKGKGYDDSYQDKEFLVQNFADKINRFTCDSVKFDLVILSTCYGGTPYTINKLVPFTKTIVASPENLHLSYFDLFPLEGLDVDLRDGNITAFAENYAYLTFNRLQKDIQTAITIAVYDSKQVQDYLARVDSVYNHDLTTLNEQNQKYVEHCDCADEPAYSFPEMSKGVKGFYRPPNFGRLKNKTNHSGWECCLLLKATNLFYQF